MTIIFKWTIINIKRRQYYINMHFLGCSGFCFSIVIQSESIKNILYPVIRCGNNMNDLENTDLLRQRLNEYHGHVIGIILLFSLVLIGQSKSITLSFYDCVFVSREYEKFCFSFFDIFQRIEISHEKKLH